MLSYSNMAFKQTMGRTPYNYLSVQTNGDLTYSADGVVQPGTKFAIENASGNMVHIRSCANNKYWVRLNGGDARNNLIVAQAVEPVVDQTSPVCTLFSIRIDSNNKRATFYHVQSGRVVGQPLVGGYPTGNLSIDPSATTQAISDVFDYDALVILPKFVAFKGSNDLYYKNSQKMFTEKEIGSPDIVCECHYSTDGHLRVRAVSSKPGEENLFWTTSNIPEGTVVMPAPSNPTDARQMFNVIKVANNVIALRSRVDNRICLRAIFQVIPNYLVPSSLGMGKDAHLEIIEPVYNRTVTVFEFNLDKARIYGVELLYTDSHIWDNPTDETQGGTADGRITTSKSHTFTNNVTVSGTVTANFQTGIPFIAQGKLEVSATASYTHEWAETTTETQQVGHIFNVVVLPRKRTVARGTATKARCNVPFAYTQRDYPRDGGPPRVTTLYDGVFTGANAYNFHSQVHYEELPTYNGPAPTKCIKRIELHKG